MAINKNGFTLIELLVVIVIIGLLSTISVSSFMGYQEKARSAKAKFAAAQVKKQFLAENAVSENNIFTTWFDFEGDSVQTTNPFVIDKSDANNNLTHSFGTGSYAQDPNDTPLGLGDSLKITNWVIQKTTGVTVAPVDKVTMAFWLKINDLSQNFYPVMISGRTGFHVWTSGVIAYYIEGGVYGHSAVYSTVNLKEGKWYYIMGTYNADTRDLKIYIDGAMVGTRKVTQTAPYLFNERAVALGSTLFDGWMDDFMLLPYEFDGEQMN